MTERIINRNTERWCLKHMHCIMIYMNCGGVFCATVLDTFLVRNILKSIRLTYAYKKSESTLKMSMLMMFLACTLLINWFLVIMGKLSPLCYILYQNHEDFIKEVPTNTISDI